MGKYETEFELQVVESFLTGDGGAKLLARRWSVPEEMVRTWVNHYRLHGVAGLQPKRGAYTAHFKLQVLSHQDREQLSSRRWLRVTTFAIRTRLSFGGEPLKKAVSRHLKAEDEHTP